MNVSKGAFPIYLWLLLGCSATPHPLSVASNSTMVKGYSTFDEYVALTEKQLVENRFFISRDKDAELKANLPIELKPQNGQKTTKGVLLIHGLGDSPYSYVDIAPSLAERGYLVRTILLPGHGTRPGDMLEVNYEEWNDTVEKQVELLKKEVNDVYLGGYSTGGNLAYSYAVKDESIKGLMLFAPAFKTNEPLIAVTPWITKIIPWILGSEPENVTNYTRYHKTPTNGIAQYYKTSREAKHKLEDSIFERPIFMVLSEHDSVIDSEAIRELFYSRFSHPNNKLIWFGTTPVPYDKSSIFIHSYSEEFRTSSMSHIGMLFRIDNPYYGIDGVERICSSKEDDRCRTDEKIWYGEWGAQSNDNIHARLTFNPWYQTMINHLELTFSSDNIID